MSSPNQNQPTPESKTSSTKPTDHHSINIPSSKQHPFSRTSAQTHLRTPAHTVTAPQPHRHLHFQLGNRSASSSTTTSSSSSSSSEHDLDRAHSFNPWLGAQYGKAYAKGWMKKYQKRIGKSKKQRNSSSSSSSSSSDSEHHKHSKRQSHKTALARLGKPHISQTHSKQSALPTPSSSLADPSPKAPNLQIISTSTLQSNSRHLHYQNAPSSPPFQPRLQRSKSVDSVDSFIDSPAQLWSRLRSSSSSSTSSSSSSTSSSSSSTNTDHPDSSDFFSELDTTYQSHHTPSSNYLHHPSQHFQFFTQQNSHHFPLNPSSLANDADEREISSITPKVRRSRTFYRWRYTCSKLLHPFELSRGILHITLVFFFCFILFYNTQREMIYHRSFYDFWFDSLVDQLSPQAWHDGLDAYNHLITPDQIIEISTRFIDTFNNLDHGAVEYYINKSPGVSVSIRYFDGKETNYNMFDEQTMGILSDKTALLDLFQGNALDLITLSLTVRHYAFYARRHCMQWHPELTIEDTDEYGLVSRLTVEHLDCSPRSDVLALSSLTFADWLNVATFLNVTLLVLLYFIPHANSLRYAFLSLVAGVKYISAWLIFLSRYKSTPHHVNVMWKRYEWLKLRQLEIQQIVFRLRKHPKYASTFRSLQLQFGTTYFSTRETNAFAVQHATLPTIYFQDRNNIPTAASLPDGHGSLRDSMSVRPAKRSDINVRDRRDSFALGRDSFSLTRDSFPHIGQDDVHDSRNNFNFQTNSSQNTLYNSQNVQNTLNQSQNQQGHHNSFQVALLSQPSTPHQIQQPLHSSQSQIGYQPPTIIGINTRQLQLQTSHQLLLNQSNQSNPLHKQKIQEQSQLQQQQPQPQPQQQQLKQPFNTMLKSASTTTLNNHNHNQTPLTTSQSYALPASPSYTTISSTYNRTQSPSSQSPHQQHQQQQQQQQQQQGPSSASSNVPGSTHLSSTPSNYVKSNQPFAVSTFASSGVVGTPHEQKSSKVRPPRKIVLLQLESQQNQLHIQPLYQSNHETNLFGHNVPQNAPGDASLLISSPNRHRNSPNTSAEQPMYPYQSDNRISDQNFSHPTANNIQIPQPQQPHPQLSFLPSIPQSPSTPSMLPMTPNGKNSQSRKLGYQNSPNHSTLLNSMSFRNPPQDLFRQNSNLAQNILFSSQSFISTPQSLLQQSELSQQQPQQSQLPPPQPFDRDSFSHPITQPYHQFPQSASSTNVPITIIIENYYRPPRYQHHLIPNSGETFKNKDYHDSSSIFSPKRTYSTNTPLGTPLLRPVTKGLKNASGTPSLTSSQPFQQHHQSYHHQHQQQQQHNQQNHRSNEGHQQPYQHHPDYQSGMIIPIPLGDFSFQLDHLHNNPKTDNNNNISNTSTTIDIPGGNGSGFLYSRLQPGSQPDGINISGLPGGISPHMTPRLSSNNVVSRIASNASLNYTNNTNNHSRQPHDSPLIQRALQQQAQLDSSSTDDAQIESFQSSSILFSNFTSPPNIFPTDPLEPSITNHIQLDQRIPRNLSVVKREREKRQRGLNSPSLQGLDLNVPSPVTHSRRDQSQFTLHQFNLDDDQLNVQNSPYKTPNDKKSKKDHSGIKGTPDSLYLDGAGSRNNTPTGTPLNTPLGTPKAISGRNSNSYFDKQRHNSDSDHYLPRESFILDPKKDSKDKKNNHRENEKLNSLLPREGTDFEPTASHILQLNLDSSSSDHALASNTKNKHDNTMIDQRPLSISFSQSNNNNADNSTILMIRTTSTNTSNDMVMTTDNIGDNFYRNNTDNTNNTNNNRHVTQKSGLFPPNDNVNSNNNIINNTNNTNNNSILNTLPILYSQPSGHKVIDTFSQVSDILSASSTFQPALMGTINVIPDMVTNIQPKRNNGKRPAVAFDLSNKDTSARGNNQALLSPPQNNHDIRSTRSNTLSTRANSRKTALHIEYESNYDEIYQLHSTYFSDDIKRSKNSTEVHHITCSSYTSRAAKRLGMACDLWFILLLVLTTLTLIVLLGTYSSQRQIVTLFKPEMLQIILGAAAFIAVMLLYPTFNLLPPDFRHFQTTIAAAWPALSRLLLGTVPILCGYAFFGYLVFFQISDRFSSLSATFTHLFSNMKGDGTLDFFGELEQSISPHAAHSYSLRIIARIFCYSYTLFFTILFAKLTLALVGHFVSFDEEHNLQKKEEKREKKRIVRRINKKNEFSETDSSDSSSSSSSSSNKSSSSDTSDNELFGDYPNNANSYSIDTYNNPYNFANTPHHYFSHKDAKKHRVKPLVNEYGVGYNHSLFIAQSYTMVIDEHGAQL